jgi:hypothetical protein
MLLKLRAVLKSFLARPDVRGVLRYTFVTLGIVLVGVFLFRACGDKPAVITQTTERTVTVEVPVEKLTTKTIVQYVQDDKEVARLMAENARLKVQVAALNETLATYTAHGTGQVAQVPTETLPPVLRPSEAPTVFQFKDWRLHFTTDGQDARYTLTQKFEVLSTLGKNDKGTPVSLVKLFEIGPDGQRLPIVDTQTTTVVATGKGAGWHFSPTLQAGVGFTADKSKSRATGGVLGVQWLKRGTSKAAEDSTWSALTPVVFLSGDSKTREIGILPFSYNAGQIKFVPFKDVWLSPYIGFNPSTRVFGHAGITVTASF